jgi:hypothetical protein
MWHVFRTRKSRRQFTTISQQFTTKTPQIDHQKTPTFSETPPKNTPQKHPQNHENPHLCIRPNFFLKNTSNSQTNRNHIQRR